MAFTRPLSRLLSLVELLLPRPLPLLLLPPRELSLIVPFPRLLPLLPLRELSLTELPRELLLLPLRELSLLRSVAEAVPRPEDTELRSGALVVVREPVVRSVTVTVLSERLLVMRLPERPVGLFCTVIFEREVVMLPTSGRLVGV